jgi:aminodeoxychorismate synthase component I/2-amino-4-hydroxy-6-hydroxymethyldihydropteridine diphosphokinase
MHDIGIFTTIKVIQGVPLYFDKHLDRLTTQTNTLGLVIPKLSLATITDYLKKNNLTNCALRITVRNTTSIDHRPLPEEKPLSVITVDDTRNKYKTLKTTDRTVNDAAKKLAQQNGADDALFVKDTCIIESTTANVFSIDKSGDLITPPIENKGLNGIARQVLMERMHVKEMPISSDTNMPLVVVNSLRVQPIRELDGRILPDAGELVKKINNVLNGFRYQLLETWIDPQTVFQTLYAKAENSYWLDSSMINASSRFSYMGVPKEIISYTLGQNFPDIFSILQNRLATKNTTIANVPFDFVGGYVGYFGYELKTLTGAQTKYKSKVPDSLWFYSENFIAFDHHEQKIYLVSLENDERWFEDIRNVLKKTSDNKAVTKINDQSITFKLARNHEQYIKDIAVCKEYLTRGDSYQICLTNTITVQQMIDPFQLYLKLRNNNPAPYAVFLKHKDLAIVSSSPEEFLAIDKNRFVETKPIKGTIQRGKNTAEDKQFIKQLQTDNKEWSENAMIVDLLRNDLGKVCEFGSIQIAKLMELETYATVHQLVSTIRGKVKKGVSVIDCIKACFPGGSMTGVPKKRTMEIIDDLEKEARGIYSGSIGFLSLNGTAKLNIAIRTIVVDDDALIIGAGGAIVAGSDPEKEYEEMILKANVLMQSITQTAGAKDYTVEGSTSMAKVYIALGSNVGDKKANIETAIKQLGKYIKKISVAKLYKSEPMYFENQEKFYNTVLSGFTKLSPEELLKFTQKAEEDIGRIKRFRNGPREIDIDILFYDDLVYKQKQLQIPHPKMQEREFVLKPFMDLEPKFVHPVLKKTIQQIYMELQNK